MKAIKFGLGILTVATVLIAGLSPVASAASSPVGSYAAGDRVLKELIRKCENGTIVSSQAARERCRVIVTYLNHPDSKTKCDIRLSFTAAKKAKLDEASVHDCRQKVDALNPNPGGAGTGGAAGGSKFSCGKVDTYFDFGSACDGTDKAEGGRQSPIIALGLTIAGWVTALVVVSVVGGIVYGGFLYLTARDDTGQTQKGITVIVNSVVALIIWVFAYALINFIVPGGLFRG